MRLLLAASLFALMPLNVAAQPAESDDLLDVPAVPSVPTPDGAIEPEVTIIETENEVIYEYRVKGQLYMVKIDPIAGPPYYLLDTNGDGKLDVQDQRPPALAVPQWEIFSW